MRYIIHVSDGYDYIGPFLSKEDARACGKRARIVGITKA